MRKAAAAGLRATSVSRGNNALDCWAAPVTWQTCNASTAAVAPSLAECAHSEAPATPNGAHSGPPPLMDFSNPRKAFAAKTTGELLRQLLVLRTCQIRPIVQYADTLLDASERFLGRTITYGSIRHTFFGHFVAGEDQQGIQPTLKRLRDNGIGGILDYAAEDDVKTEGPAQSRVVPHDLSVGRTFFYEDESKCNRHMETFEKAIEAAATQSVEGFAAIKMTALGMPQLLERVSNSLQAIQELFEQFDIDHSSNITKEEFRDMYKQLFVDYSEEVVDQLFEFLDEEHRGKIDYVAWSKKLRVQDAPMLAARCRDQGPFAASVLSAHELQLVDNMMDRLDRLAAKAAKDGVRLMVDAEHSYFQPAIDNAVIEMQRKYNKDAPIVFNTYQCYLRNCRERVERDLDRGRREGFHFGAKLVRGAYMHLERARASSMGYKSPVFDTIEETHTSYDRCVEQVLRAVKTEGAEVMLATHNQASIEKAVVCMSELGIDPRSSGVYFGQLLGMADNLTYTLGTNEYKAYKYVPFGPIDLVMPYLIRRAQENADLMGGVGIELRMVQQELLRRMSGGLLGRGVARA